MIDHGLDKGLDMTAGAARCTQQYASQGWEYLLNSRTPLYTNKFPTYSFEMW